MIEEKFFLCSWFFSTHTQHHTHIRMKAFFIKITFLLGFANLSATVDKILQFDFTNKVRIG
jgi:hypothetical protein